MAKEADDKNLYRKCDSCGWIHFSVTRQYAEDEVKKFNDYYDTLTKEMQQENYGGRGSSIVSYERCGFCGGSYKNFVDALDSEIRMGSTVSPIIEWNKKKVFKEELAKVLDETTDKE